MKEAMEQVKEELGRDAVILHTKKYREGGFMGYKGKEVVEVTAAIEENAPESPAKSRPRRSADAAHGFVPVQDEWHRNRRTHGRSAYCSTGFSAADTR